MTFAQKLKDLMKQADLSQKDLHDLTGIGQSSISQYLNGRNEPTKKRKREIAKALGVAEDYFEVFEPVAKIDSDSTINVPVPVIAKLMGKSKAFVTQGLRDGVFPWGYAVKLTNWSYFISSKKFTEYTGIPVPKGCDAA